MSVLSGIENVLKEGDIEELKYEIFGELEDIRNQLYKKLNITDADIICNKLFLLENKIDGVYNLIVNNKNELTNLENKLTNLENKLSSIEIRF